MHLLNTLNDYCTGALYAIAYSSPVLALSYFYTTQGLGQ